MSSSAEEQSEKKKLAAERELKGRSFSLNFMDSLFHSIESGFERVIHSVDAASIVAAKFINETLENMPEEDGNMDLQSGIFTPIRRQRSVTSFFGSSLKDLVLDEFRCSHALLNPVLGIPTQAVKMINFISTRIDSPELFRQRASLVAVAELRRLLEEEQGIPQDADIATVAHVFIQWLNQLPEPLLGYQHYDALVACQNVVDSSSAQSESERDAHKIRNLSLLVQESPWYCRPLLVKIMALLGKCIQPDLAATNRLNPIAVAVLAAPFILRPYTGHSRSSGKHGAEEAEQAILAAAAVGSSPVQYIIMNQSAIFSQMRQELTAKQNILAAKCTRIQSLQDKLPIAVNCSNPATLDAEQQRAIRELFDALAPIEQQLSITSMDDLTKLLHQQHGHGAGHNFSGERSPATPLATTTEPVDSLDALLFSDLSMEEILAHRRWSVCGFVSTATSYSAPSTSMSLSEELAEQQTNDILMREFNTQNGLVALTCLTAFLKRYREKGAIIIKDFCQNRHHFCTIAQVASRLTYFTADVLQLFPPMDSSTATSSRTQQQQLSTPLNELNRLASQWSWILLNEESCFQDMFDVAMLSFDDAWRNQCDKVEQLPTAETYAQSLFKCRKTLWEIIGQKPKSVAMVWEFWLNNRLADQEQIFQHNVANRRPVLVAQSTAPPVDRSNVVIATHATAGASDKSSPVQGTVIPTPLSVATVSAGSAVAPSSSSYKSPVIGTVVSSSSGSSTKSQYTADVPSSSAVPVSAPPPVKAPVSSSKHPSAKAPSPTLPPPPTMHQLHHNTSFSEVRDFGEDWNVDLSAAAMAVHVQKQVSGIVTTVIGGSTILSEKHIQQLEAALPQTYQCLDWRLLYRLSIHGANLSTLVQKAQGVPNTLLVVRDSNGTVFGALVSEYLKMSEKEKYYGNGTIGVWSFVSGSLKYYNWSFKNSYFLISSKDSLAFGGGGNFAIHLDGDLNHGSSGPCNTFNSPCLASSEEFVCNSCELYALESYKG